MADQVSLDDPEPPVEDQKSSEADYRRPARSSAKRSIKILRTEERKSTLSKYLVYIIECDPKPKGVVTVARRYSDFLWLRTFLGNRYPALWVPPIPPKKMIGRFNEEFVENRRRDLERYLARLDAINVFADSDAFQMFLSRPESTFQVGTKELDTALKTETWETRTNELQKFFPDLHEEPLPATSTQDVDRLKEFMDKCKSQLESLLDSCRACLAKHDAHMTEISTLTDTFKNLYTTEKNYPYCPEPQRIDVSKQFMQWEDFESQQTKLFELDFLQTINHEYEDVVAMIELLTRHNQATTRYQKFNTRAEALRKKASEGTLSEKQQVAKAEDEAQEKTNKGYLDMATKLLLMQEAKRVWDQKVETFEMNMQDFSEKQLTQTDKMSKIWSEAINPQSAEA